MNWNLYVLVTKDEVFKVGIANNINHRIPNVTDENLVDRDASFFVAGEKASILKLEKTMHFILSDSQIPNPYPGKTGFTEWFSVNCLPQCVKLAREICSQKSGLEFYSGIPRRKVLKSQIPDSLELGELEYSRIQKRILNKYINFLPALETPIAVNRKPTRIGYEYELLYKNTGKGLSSYKRHVRREISYNKLHRVNTFSVFYGFINLFGLSETIRRKPLTAKCNWSLITRYYSISSTENIVNTKHIGLLKNECMTINKWLESIYKEKSSMEKISPLF